MILLKVLKRFFKLKIYLWFVLILIIAGGGLFFVGKSSQNLSKSQVLSSVQYLEDIKEVGFLSVGIEKVVTKENSKDFLGMTFPFSKKTALIIMRYKAKLGIKKAVKVDAIGENSFVVSLPPIEVLGIELDEKDPYVLYDKNGEIFSAFTEDIDTAQLFSKEVSNASQKEYLKKYTPMVHESAEDYYKMLFQSINPDFKVTVKFSD